MDVLRRLDAYLDLAPRAHSDAIDVGPLRVFVSRAPWPYYIRPRAELDLTGREAVDPEHIRAAASVLESRGHDVSLEWIDDLVPSLRVAALEAGFTVSLHPLLTRDLTTPPRGGVAAHAAYVVSAESGDVAAALRVQDVAFRQTGTDIGPEGPAARDALDLDPGLARFARAEIESGHAVLAVVCDQSGVVACGWHAPRGGTTEITGVSTLPSARHRGHAAVVVEALIEDAAAGGCTTALLSADGDAVASIYERVGFRRVGVSASAVMHS